MIMLDRTQAPEFKNIDIIPIQKAVRHELDNHLKFYSVNAGDMDVVKLELVFDAGSAFQSKPLVASTVSNLLFEGTKTKTGPEIAEYIDFYGAFNQTESGKDSSSVILYSLSKHLNKLLPLLKEVLTEASFPQKELDVYRQNQIQKFKVDNQKVSYLARRHFLNLLFGDNNFYGYFLKEEDFDQLTDAELKSYFHNRYSSNNCYGIIAGKVTSEVMEEVCKVFGSDWRFSDHLAVPPIEFFQPKEFKKLVEKSDALQSAIRIGRRLFNKTHGDYPGMLVLNTVLGGYFGSRLMANIREDKGYTYGIGSGIMPLAQTGYFFISTEVGADVCSKAIDEIYFEIRRLREELIPSEELDQVRNYMLGVMLKDTDGPFSLAERFKSIHEFGLGYEYYERFCSTIKTITSEELNILANKYLKEEDLLEVVAGKK
jgi:zinc protease